MEDNIKIYYGSERNNTNEEDKLNEIELITENADIYYKDKITNKFNLLLLYRNNEIPNKYLKPLSEIKSIKEIKLQNGKTLKIDKPSELNLRNKPAEEMQKYFDENDPDAKLDLSENQNKIRRSALDSILKK
jgi:hypothetical protein